MKKVLLIVFYFVISVFQGSFAQMVYMPDSVLRQALTNMGYGSCITGDSIDPACTAVANATFIDVSNYGIHSLEGIDAFTSLNKLICEDNTPLSIPALPNSLDTLKAANCNLSGLPALPSGLIFLDVSHGQLDSLPALPSTLEWLDCGYNNITSLPTLPPVINTIQSAYNDLTVLPVLPASLEYLDCGSNHLTSLPALPAALEQLHFDQNSISSLATVPSTLVALSCANNFLTTLPALPSGLISLLTSNNPLTSFPSVLPPGLGHLICAKNNLTSLPPLPSTLYLLWCSHNSISTLPALPAGLDELDCDHNVLSFLPSLPSTLTTLDCSKNQLTSLPTLPVYLDKLLCDSNQLSSLPELPDSLFTFWLRDNPFLFCLPQLKKVVNMDFQNCPVSCLPNYGQVLNSTPALSSLPLCDPLNPGNCNFYWNLSGASYLDIDSNCVKDSLENVLRNLHLNLYENGNLIQQAYTGSEGFYSFDVNTFGNFTTELDTNGLPFNIICPATNQYSDTLTAVDSMVTNNDFALQCKNGFDIGVWSMVSTRLRPVHLSTVSINAGDLAVFYGAHCAQGISGTIDVQISGPAHYYSPAAGMLSPTASTANSVTFTINDFGVLDMLGFIIETDTAALPGSQVCFTASVSPTLNDNNPANNTLSQCFTVFSSLDPNDKQVYPSGDIDSTQDNLTYTIQFQNTGNAPAENIYLIDTISPNLEINSLQLLSTSHNCYTQVLSGGIVRFNFANINLDDSLTNEAKSHGYVQYKIKVKDNLANGTKIYNTAYIYFDFNSAVITNTVTSTINFNIGVNELNEKIDLNIWPVPFDNSLTLKTEFNKGSIAVLNALGKMFFIGELAGQQTIINTEAWPAGIYLLKMQTENGVVVKQLVKQ